LGEGVGWGSLVSSDTETYLLVFVTSQPSENCWGGVMVFSQRLANYPTL